MTISETDDDQSFSNTNHDDHRRLSLIDVSSADDSLIANSFHHLSDKFFTQNSTDEFDDAATKIHEWDREPRLNQIQNNLRQSLAWDSAFFTSAGVLEPEELSSMIKGVEKGDKRVSLLPAIQEDVHGSCESISTFESSNSFTQESLEDADLFQDVRASIQNFGRMSDLARANRNVPSRLQAGSSSTAVGMASSKKAPSSNSPNASMQGPRKLPKKNSISPHLSRVSAARREEPCISKQPKTLGNSSPSSTISSNRSSRGDLHVKSEKDKANKNNCGKVDSLMNNSVIKGSQVNELKSVTSSKSPIGPSVATKTKLPSPSSSRNLSRNISKSPLNSLKRKVDAGTKKSPSSCSVVRTPPRIASRDKIGSSSSSLSGLSATKFSPSISPASSISNWSSESSSSTSMSKFRSNSSRATFHSISNRKAVPENGARHVSNSKKSQSGSCLEGKKTRDAGSISQCVRASAGMVATPSPKKPLGLRQPSPKIGFFEGVKSSVRSPRGGMQPCTIAPHGRVSPSEGQNKAKVEKLQSPRSIISTKNKEFVNQQPLPLVRLNKSSDVKTSMALPHVESSAVAPMDAQNQMHLKPGVDNLDATSTMVEGHICGEHDLNLGFTQENSQYVDQVDCLSRQVELMDINLKTQT